jgi:hypothetical protein
MEPGVATEFVTTVVAKGKDVLEGCKKRGGTLGFVVKKAEAPVETVLQWKLVKTVFDFGGGFLQFTDRRVEGTRNSAFVKASGTLYTKGVLPVTEVISSTYQKTLDMADRTVESFLPEEEEYHHTKMPIVTTRLVLRKVTRRSMTRVQEAPRHARKVLSSTLELARPSNVARNTKMFYGRSIISADKLVDRILPFDDLVVATDLVTLTRKVATRGKRSAGRTVRAAMRAVKNSPTTFKKAAGRVYATAREFPGKVKARVLQIVEMRKQVSLPSSFSLYVGSYLTQCIY